MQDTSKAMLGLSLHCSVLKMKASVIYNFTFTTTMIKYIQYAFFLEIKTIINHNFFIKLKNYGSREVKNNDSKMYIKSYFKEM